MGEKTILVVGMFGCVVQYSNAWWTLARKGEFCVMGNLAYR
jgi:hypothetical protein